MLLSNPLKVKEIAGIINGDVLGNPDQLIKSINRIEEATAGELTFCSSKQFVELIFSSESDCIIINRNYRDELGISELPQGKNFILTVNAYTSLVVLLNYLQNLKPVKSSFIHTSSFAGEGTVISESAYVGINCVLGDNCFIGNGVILHNNVVLYNNVIIGSNTEIHANVVIAEDTIIGENCIIYPGAVIGSDGFGYLENPDGSYTKIPQLGNVVIGNNVEVGANTTIDRALIGSTIIEDGVKLDNLVHIAHNVRVGENTAMAAQTGVSGSTKVGKRNRFGGQVGLSGHIETADDVTIYAQSGVAKSIPNKGIYFGTPIKERLKAFKIEAVINQLPEIARELSEIKKKLTIG